MSTEWHLCIFMYVCIHIYTRQFVKCECKPTRLLLLTLTTPLPGAMSSARASPRAPACLPCSSACVSETWRTSFLQRCSRMGKCFPLLLQGSGSGVDIASHFMSLAHCLGATVASCPRCKGHCLHFVKSCGVPQCYFCYEDSEAVLSLCFVFVRSHI